MAGRAAPAGIFRGQTRVLRSFCSHGPFRSRSSSRPPACWSMPCSSIAFFRVYVLGRVDPRALQRPADDLPLGAITSSCLTGVFWLALQMFRVVFRAQREAAEEQVSRSPGAHGAFRPGRLPRRLAQPRGVDSPLDAAMALGVCASARLSPIPESSSHHGRQIQSKKPAKPAQSPPRGPKAPKYVYLFGTKDRRRRLAEAPFWAERAPTWPKCAGSGCRCPPASRSRRRSAPIITPTAHLSGGPRRRRSKAGIASIEAQVGHEVRRPGESAARVRPLRRPRLDAGHDGHDPQPGPQRQDRRRPGAQDRQRALRLGLLPPLRPDVRRRRPRACRSARARTMSPLRP